MNQGKSGHSPYERYARILSALERELRELDQEGAHKVTAHLDTAIHQLRRDMRVLRQATAAHEEPRSNAPKAGLHLAEKAAILAPFSTSHMAAIQPGQVFARKAKPANSR